MEELARYYGRRAPEYDAIYALPERQADLARVTELLCAALAGQRVLDAPCGTGYWAERVAPVAEAVHLADVNEAMLAVARRRSYPRERVSFGTVDLRTCDGVTDSYTAALLAFWWSHVPRQELGTFLAGYHSRLGSGVRVVVVDNRFVSGSSSPVLRGDADGNTYQERRLSDGDRWEILKNFPVAADLREDLRAPRVVPDITELKDYWVMQYRTP